MIDRMIILITLTKSIIIINSFNFDKKWKIVHMFQKNLWKN